MRGADSLVVPSLSENLPVVIIEAQARHRTAGRGLRRGRRQPSSRQRGNGQLAPAAYPAALAAAIEVVLAHPTAYDRTAISTRAEERFGLEAIGARWDTIRRERLARHIRRIVQREPSGPAVVQRKRPALRGLFRNAPEKTRTSTDDTVHKALNLNRPV